MQFQVIVKRDTVRPAELRFVNIHKYTCLKALIQTHHPGSASQTTQYAVSSEEHGSPHLRYAASCSRYLLLGRKETHFCSSKNNDWNQVADKQQTLQEPLSVAVRCLQPFPTAYGRTIGWGKRLYTLCLQYRHAHNAKPKIINSLWTAASLAIVGTWKICLYSAKNWYDNSKSF